MSEYHKIQSVFFRDPDNNNRTLLEGQWSLPEFEYLAHNKWEYTEKVDGTNIRVIYTPGDDQAEGRVTFKGRTETSQMPALLVDELRNIFDKPEDMFAQDLNVPIVLYGEGYGAKIQKGGGNYLQGQSFVLFDVQIDGWWLRRKDVEDVADKLKLEVVPVIGTGDLYEMVEMCRDGIDSRWGDFQAEGIVARPQTELCTRGGQRVITKCKCKDFREI